MPRHDQYEWLHAALTAMPPLDRRCVELIYSARHSQKQAADALGVRPKIVSAAMVRALRAVAVALEQH